MKTTLLTCAAALMAMTATAQTANIQGRAITSQRFNAAVSAKPVSNLIASEAKSVAMMPVAAGKPAAKIVKAAANDEDIFGYFIHTYKGDVVEDFTQVIVDTIWKAEQTLKVVVDDQGNTQDVDCNVCLKSAFGGYRVSEEFYGVYEDESLLFPEQIILKADGVNENTGEPFHYDIYPYSYKFKEDGKSFESVVPLQFEETDGVFYCYGDGWGLFYVDRESGEGLGWGAFCADAMMQRPNGTIEWTGSDQDGNPQTINTFGFLEDYGTQVAAYGWNSTKITMLIDEDLPVKIRTGAPIADIDLKVADGYQWDAGKIVLRGYVTTDDGKIKLDLDADYIYGELKGNTILIPIIVTSSENGGSGDYQGYWYGLNLFENNKFVLDEGNYACGINEHHMTREELIKNTKTFNLMGQQVNRSLTKGLLVREGKKYINK